MKFIRPVRIISLAALIFMWEKYSITPRAAPLLEQLLELGAADQVVPADLFDGHVAV